MFQNFFAEDNRKGHPRKMPLKGCILKIDVKDTYINKKVSQKRMAFETLLAFNLPSQKETFMRQILVMVKAIQRLRRAASQLGLQLAEPGKDNRNPYVPSYNRLPPTKCRKCGNGINASTSRRTGLATPSWQLLRPCP
jgi:hypothetical protein